MKGLNEHKYIVQKSNGNPIDPHARYFVLRYDQWQEDTENETATKLAILTYADNISNEELKEDLYEAVNGTRTLSSAKAIFDYHQKKLDFENLLTIANEAIAGLTWRIEMQPDTADKADDMKLDEWKGIVNKML